jgi:hypothetical protein
MNKLLLFLIFNLGIVNAVEWKLVKEKNDIVIYSVQKPGYKLKHFKAQITLHKDTDTILTALQDTKACPLWVYNCLSNDMVDMIDFRKRVYHTQIYSPLWFKDRDFYIQSNVVYNPTEKLFKVSFVSQPEYRQEIKDTIRIKQVEMNWSLKSISDNETLVTYQVYINPKLPIKSFNHMIIKMSIYQTMLGLEKIVEKPIYADTKYSKSELEMLTQPDQ